MRVIKRLPFTAASLRKACGLEIQFSSLTMIAVCVCHVVQKLFEILGLEPLACEHACLCADSRIIRNSLPAYGCLAAQ
jgi:hypothetical protein